jgi:hypothetical protein
VIFSAQEQSVAAAARRAKHFAIFSLALASPSLDVAKVAVTYNGRL